MSRSQYDRIQLNTAETCSGFARLFLAIAFFATALWAKDKGY